MFRWRRQRKIEDQKGKRKVTCEEFLQVGLDDGWVGRLAKDLQQVIVTDEVEARKGRALLLRRTHDRDVTAALGFFQQQRPVFAYCTSRNSFSDFWQRCNWSRMVTREFRMPALELSEATLLSLWMSDIIDLPRDFYSTECKIFKYYLCF